MTENVDSVHQRATHSGCLPAMSDNEHFMEGLKVEDCERPLTFHQSSTVPDAMRYANLVLSATNTINFTEDET